VAAIQNPPRPTGLDPSPVTDAAPSQDVASAFDSGKTINAITREEEGGEVIGESYISLDENAAP